jgi:hypothetical protein
MSAFERLATTFNRQSPFTVYLATRSPSSDEAMVYPAGLIHCYGNPFEESLAESEDGSLEQVLLFSDCGSNPEVLDGWRSVARQAGSELIRLGLTVNQGFLHGETVEWMLACTRILRGLKTDFIDQDKFDIGKGLITTLQNAWEMSSFVCLGLAERESSVVDACTNQGSGDKQRKQDGGRLGLEGPLSENDRSILLAMLKLNADAIHPRPGHEILETVIIEVGDSKRVFDNLKGLGLIGSKPGPNGGRFLTERGKRIAEVIKLRSKGS